MCMMGLGAAAGALGSIAGFIGQSEATQQYNEQAAIAHRDAQIAATNKYKDVESQYVWNNKDLNEKGMNAALAAREEEAKGVASAGSMGIAPGSNTLTNLIMQTRQIAANNQANVEAHYAEQHDSLLNQDTSIEAEAQQRINAVPFKPMPNPLVAMLGIAGSMMGGGGGSMPGGGGSNGGIGGVDMGAGSQSGNGGGGLPNTNVPFAPVSSGDGGINLPSRDGMELNY